MGGRRAGFTGALIGAVALAGCAGSVPESARPAPHRTAAPALASVGQFQAGLASAASASQQSNRTVEPASAPIYLSAGVHEHQIELDGQTRHWTTVVPSAASGSKAPALVVVLHGVGEQGAKMRSKGFEPLAEERGVVLPYPDAFAGAWNDGRPGVEPVVPGVTVDDSGFLRLLIEETIARTGADSRRVAVVGQSNGAMMAARVACDLADRVSAVALVVGSGGRGFEQTCRPARPVAVMVVAGSEDATVPYAGGRVADWNGKQRGYVAGVEEFFGYWRAQNGCTSTQPLAPSATVSEAKGADCRSGNAVLRFRIEGGAHEWYQKPRFDTTGAIWEFLVGGFSTAT